MDGNDGVQVVEKADKSAPPPAGSTVIREAKIPRRKLGKGRPQSAPSKISRSISNANPIPVGAGADTSKPRSINSNNSNNRKIGRISRMGSRMREDVHNARSSSTPALRGTANGEAGKNMSADDPNEQGKGSAATGAAAVDLGADGGDNVSSSNAREDQLKLQMMETRNQELQSRCRHLEQRCAHLEADGNAHKSALVSYKAEVRAKSMAVSKAEIVLNEVCVAMASRLGRVDGVTVSPNKGRILLEVHESPAEFAAQIKKNIFLQLSKWEVDRAALGALAERAGHEAAVAGKVHEAERADLSAHVGRLGEKIQEMEIVHARLVTEAEAAAEESRRKYQIVSSAKSEVCSELEAAVARNKELCQAAADKEKEFQAELDRFMEYPKAAESMAEELDKCRKNARREKNLAALEGKEFRRQLQTFQKWHTENKDLRRRIRLQNGKVLALRRQLTAAEAEITGRASTRKAVIGGTVDRLQRAEASAKQQALRHREAAESRGVRVAQLEAEVKSLKAALQSLTRKPEAPKVDSYETEMAQLARFSPAVVEVQQKAGLDREDMEATMGELKLLREKGEHKDSLIALVRERDEFELCIKELKARNSWLEKQMSASPAVRRSIVQAQMSAQGQLEQSEQSKGAETPQRTATAAAIGGWANAEGKRGEDVSASHKTDAVSRLERHLSSRDTAPRGGGGMAPELTAKIRRNIQFLEECDWSIERQQARDHHASTRKNRQGARHGSGAAAAHAARARRRPQSAQAGCRAYSSLTGGGGGGGGGGLGSGGALLSAREGRRLPDRG